MPINRIDTLLGGSPLRRRSYAIAALGLPAILFTLAVSQFLRSFALPERLLQVLISGLLGPRSPHWFRFSSCAFSIGGSASRSG